ncbi:unnamed protein product [Closterium sp. Yama58-4]|nr:unnamed protein product [Closterium sp. Yama58-4]
MRKKGGGAGGRGRSGKQQGKEVRSARVKAEVVEEECEGEGQLGVVGKEGEVAGTARDDDDDDNENEEEHGEENNGHDGNDGNGGKEDNGENENENEEDEDALGRMTQEQIDALEVRFQQNRRLDTARKLVLAREVGVRPRQVSVWFQNRRARWRQKKKESDLSAMQREYARLKVAREQLGEDYELLKKDYEDLLLHNAALHDKVDDLMAHLVQHGMLSASTSSCLREALLTAGPLSPANTTTSPLPLPSDAATTLPAAEPGAHALAAAAAAGSAAALGVGGRGAPSPSAAASAVAYGGGVGMWAGEEVGGGVEGEEGEGIGGGGVGGEDWTQIFSTPARPPAPAAATTTWPTHADAALRAALLVGQLLVGMGLRWGGQVWVGTLQLHLCLLLLRSVSLLLLGGAASRMGIAAGSVATE